MRPFGRVKKSAKSPPTSVRGEKRKATSKRLLFNPPLGIRDCWISRASIVSAPQMWSQQRLSPVEPGPISTLLLSAEFPRDRVHRLPTQAKMRLSGPPYLPLSLAQAYGFCLLQHIWMCSKRTSMRTDRIFTARARSGFAAPCGSGRGLFRGQRKTIRGWRGSLLAWRLHPPPRAGSRREETSQRRPPLQRARAARWHYRPVG